jgi:threonine aldolase
MMNVKIGFGSDNHSGAHPQILRALMDANQGHEPSYGTDSISARLEPVFEKHFGKGTKHFFVFNGTAANVLSLDSFLKPYQAVICAETCHLQNDECGAPERWTGAKLQTVPSKDGKLTVEDIQRCLVRRGDQHYSQIAAVSITQPTELGTVYTLAEIRAITEFAHANGLLVHLDGARLVNAAASLGVSLQALTRDSGIDVLSFGGTKNGLVFGEAVVFFNPRLCEDFKFRRKQAMQLPSKTRFIAAQFEAFLAKDLWLENAQIANQRAQELAAGLKENPYVTVTQPTQANAVFVKIPKAWVASLREKFFFYVWDEHTFECRLMTSFDTTPEAVRGFLQALDEIAQSRTK